MQYKRINIRLYPTKQQEVVLENHFNGYRWAYNLCLEYKIKMYWWYNLNLSGYDMQKELFEIRKESVWLSKCKAECIRQAALDVDSTFKKFFKGKGFPKFKKKLNKQSFTSYQSIRIKKNKLSFFNNLFQFRTSDDYKKLLKSNKLKSCTFKKLPTGKYFASCLIEVEDKPKYLANNNVIGIDMGISTFITTSDAEYIENPKFYINSIEKLRKEQKRLSRKQKGSNNWNKQRIKLARVYEKITNQRQHFFHQVSNRLISENQTIVCETLAVKNMIKNRNLSKHIADASWGTFLSILEYKCNWYGRNLIKVDKFYPSSKLCSNCGDKKDKLLLSERIYNCENCKLSINRDYNASLNLKKLGLKESELTLVETSSVECL